MFLKIDIATRKVYKEDILMESDEKIWCKQTGICADKLGSKRGRTIRQT